MERQTQTVRKQRQVIWPVVLLLTISGSFPGLVVADSLRESSDTVVRTASTGSISDYTLPIAVIAPIAVFVFTVAKAYFNVVHKIEANQLVIKQEIESIKEAVVDLERDKLSCDVHQVCMESAKKAADNIERSVDELKTWMMDYMANTLSGAKHIGD
jgi:hypothetical protein